MKTTSRNEDDLKKNEDDPKNNVDIKKDYLILTGILLLMDYRKNLVGFDTIEIRY